MDCMNLHELGVSKVVQCGPTQLATPWTSWPLGRAVGSWRCPVEHLQPEMQLLCNT